MYSMAVVLSEQEKKKNKQIYIQIPSEERVRLKCFKNSFIEKENEEHFLLRCLHPTSKYIEKTFCLRLEQSCHLLIFEMTLINWYS